MLIDGLIKLSLLVNVFPARNRVTSAVPAAGSASADAPDGGTRCAFSSQGIEEELAEEQPQDLPGPPGAVSEVGLLDLATENIDTVIWATGYTYDLSSRLYFLGLYWMHAIKSGLRAELLDRRF